MDRNFFKNALIAASSVGVGHYLISDFESVVLSAKFGTAAAWGILTYDVVQTWRGGRSLVPRHRSEDSNSPPKL